MDSPRRTFSTGSKSTVQEGDCSRLVISGDDMTDLVSLTSKTPFDELVTAEERALITGVVSEEERSIRIAAISGVLSFLFKPIGDKIPSPWETAVRLWLLVFTVNPSLCGSISLERMGRLFGSVSKQTLSKRLLKQNSSLSLRARNSKSASAVESYRASCTEHHRKRREELRREARRAYNQAYKKAHRDRISVLNRSYYEQNRARILTTQRKRRLK